MKLEIDSLFGNCPVQGWGSIGGLPFYFRARGEHWSFSVADTVETDPVDVAIGAAQGYFYEEPYGESEFAAGWMEISEARIFIQKAAGLYEQWVDSPGEQEDDLCNR